VQQPAAGLAAHPRGQQPHGRVLEQLDHRHRGVQCEHRAHRGERVAAEGEEVVVDADPLGAQHLPPDARDQALQLGPRLDVLAAGLAAGRRQGLAVELAVRGQRQRVEQHERRRHQELGQRGGQVLAQPGRRRLGARRRHHVGHQAAVAAPVVVGDDHHRADVGVRLQVRRDLAQLDAVAANLDLLVDPAQVLQLAGGQPAHQVTGAVAALARRPADEPLVGQLRPVEVPAGQPGAADVQLARDPDRHRRAMLVEHVAAQVRQRPPDRGRHPAVQVGPRDPAVRDVHRGLGDAVHVDQRRPPVAVLGEPLRQLAHVQRVAAEHDRAQRQVAQRPAGRGERGAQPAERRRRLVEHGDPLGAQHVEQRLVVAHHVGRHDDQPAAPGQGAPQLPHREVERVRVQQRPHVVRAEVEQLGGGREQPHHLAVLDEHALRPAGRARRVDHVGEAVRPRQRCRVGAGGGGRVVNEQHVAAVLGHPVA
jgi:hypothetical protein